MLLERRRDDAHGDTLPLSSLYSKHAELASTDGVGRSWGQSRLCLQAQRWKNMIERCNSTTAWFVKCLRGSLITGREKQKLPGRLPPLAQAAPCLNRPHPAKTLAQPLQCS
jgi:hypothetical protein